MRPIKNLIIQADIVLGRGLYKQSGKLLKKVRKIANSAEDHPALLEIGTLDQRLAVLQQNRQFLENYQQRVKEEKELLEIQQNQLLYSEAGNRMSMAQLKNIFMTDPEQEKVLTDLANGPLFSSESNAKSLSAKRMYHIFLAKYYRAKGEYEQSYAHRKDLITLIEDNPNYLEAHFHTYVIELFNFLLSLKEMKKYKEWELRQSMLVKLVTDRKNEKRLSFILPKLLAYTWYLELDLYLDTDRLDQALKATQRIELVQKKYVKYLTKADHAQLNYKMAYVHFCQGNQKEALSYTNNIINELSGDARGDIGLFTRILSVFIHFEMEHFELLEYLSKQIKRYQTKVKLYPKFTRTVLELIRDTEADPNKNISQASIMSDYRSRFQEVLADKAEATVIYYMDVDRWLVERSS